MKYTAVYTDCRHISCSHFKIRNTINDEGDEEREMVGLKGLERFWGLDENSSSIKIAAEQFENLHRNRKIKFYGKQRPTEDDSFFLLSFR